MNRLKTCRLEKGLKQSDVAGFLKIATNSYSQWETGKREPDYKSLIALADYFGVSVDYLLEREETPTPAYSDIPNVRQIIKKKIPVLGEIACGKPIFADEQRDVYVSVSDELVCDYALIARGDSMAPRILPGDLVFIREMPVVPNGKIAAVLIDEEATLKRVFFDAVKQQLTLTADNPAYAPFVYNGEELMQIRILGQAVAAQTKL